MDKWTEEQTDRQTDRNRKNNRLIFSKTPVKKETLEEVINFRKQGRRKEKRRNERTKEDNERMKRNSTEKQFDKIVGTRLQKTISCVWQMIVLFTLSDISRNCYKLYAASP